jgi:hypothetical protein
MIIAKRPPLLQRPRGCTAGIAHRDLHCIRRAAVSEPRPGACPDPAGASACQLLPAAGQPHLPWFGDAACRLPAGLAMAWPISPCHSSLEWAAIRRCCASGIRVRHDHLANGPAWGQSAAREFIPGIYAGAEADPVALDQAIGATSWFSWVVDLLLVEWWLHRGIRRDQRRSNRMTTRGNPPETALVSAALVKPASSKTLRVPT